MYLQSSLANDSSQNFPHFNIHGVQSQSRKTTLFIVAGGGGRREGGKDGGREKGRRERWGKGEGTEGKMGEGGREQRMKRRRENKGKVHVYPYTYDRGGRVGKQTEVEKKRRGICVSMGRLNGTGW